MPCQLAGAVHLEDQLLELLEARAFAFLASVASRSWLPVQRHGWGAAREDLFVLEELL